MKYNPGLLYVCRLCNFLYVVGPESRKCCDWKEHPEGRIWHDGEEWLCCHAQDSAFFVKSSLDRKKAKTAPII